MLFEVRSVSSANEILVDLIDARDASDARAQIEARGCMVTSIGQQSVWKQKDYQQKSSIRKHGALTLFSQELLALLTAGLTIVEALEALLEKEQSSGTHALLSRLLTGLREGKRFSSVLAEQTDVFPPLFVGMIHTAEGTSDLPRSLARYIEYDQRLEIVRNKVISSSIYPLILLCVGGTVSFFLIGYVVPKFSEVYQDTGRSLPLMSQLLLEWGQFVSKHTLSILLSTFLIIGATITGMYRQYLNGNLRRLIHKVPKIGERVKIYELSRLYLTLGMLLEGGVTITSALGTARNMMSDEMREQISCAIKEIESGSPLSITFERYKLATPISLRMLRVGERSGELGLMLTQSAAFYDNEINRWIDHFTRAFEPILMAVIGLIVGTIVVLLYMPIFDLAGSLS